MHFGEYELSPSLISLSPLPSAHPEAFQRLLVRSSSWCYPAFNLAKGRSLGFASATADYTPSSDSLSLRIRVSSHLTLPAKATRRFIMQKARRHCQKAAPTACRRRVSGSLSPFSSKCFSPFLHSTRPLSVSREYSALPDGPGGFAQDSSCPALLRMPLCRRKLRVRGYHPLRRGFPAASPRHCRATPRSYNPRRASPHAGFGLLPGRSPLLGESRLISFPRGT